MRLTQLQYLLEIKKQGSISKAAQHLYIAQPSMSAAIKELEEELGYELMKRSKKGVTFTSLGEQVIGIGSGRTKKAAEQEAAYRALIERHKAREQTE